MGGMSRSKRISRGSENTEESWLAACSTRRSTSPAGIVVSPNWTGSRVMRGLPSPIGVTRKISSMDPGDRTLLPQLIILLGKVQAMIGERKRIRRNLLLVGFIAGCLLLIAHLCSPISTRFQPKAGSVVLLVHGPVLLLKRVYPKLSLFHKSGAGSWEGRRTDVFC